MRTHFHHEMQALREAVLALGDAVCRNVSEAVTALRTADDAAAAKVMRADRDIDRREVVNEEHCLKIIALHQPVADDLRTLVVMLKVNHELERISDLAVDIAEGVHAIDPAVCASWEARLVQLAQDASERVLRSLNALLEADAGKARDVWLGDADIDRAAAVLAADLRRAICAGGPGCESLFCLLDAAARVERLADHAKNIAKDVIYLVLGEIVRHRSQDFRGHGPGTRQRVLFVCIHNSARSQMAAAWLNHLAGDRFEAESAGLEPGTLNPLAVTVMREAGIDISGATPRDVFDVIRTSEPFDFLVTVCDEAAAARCPPAPGSRLELNWSFPDPGQVTGTDAEKLQAVRVIRDAIRARLEAWLATETPGGAAHAPTAKA